MTYKLFSAVSLAVASLLAAPSAQAQNVKFVTSMGDIVVQLDAAKAPKTVANFVQYVKAGQYNGTIFHRVISDFMIQGGGMNPDMYEKPTRAPIPLESRNGLSNERGTISMARTNIPDSATAQFFINVKDNTRLNATPNADVADGYAVFGKVISGMDVVDKIRVVQVGNKGGHQNVPVETVLIKSATIQP